MKPYFKPYFSEWLVQRYFGGWWLVAIPFAIVGWLLWEPVGGILWWVFGR